MKQKIKLKEQSEQAKAEILNKLRTAAKYKTNTMPHPKNWDEAVFPVPEDLFETFKQELETINGELIVIENDKQFADVLTKLIESKQWPNIYCIDPDFNSNDDLKGLLTNNPDDYEGMQAGLTGCEYLVARTGSVVVSSNGGTERSMYAFPPVHIVYAKSSQLVPFIHDAIASIKVKYKPRHISVITGPSRTADIEKTLVMGAHGPKELIVILNTAN